MFRRRCGFGLLLARHNQNPQRKPQSHPFSTAEDGGSPKEVPLTYDRFQKRKYMRRDHPLRRDRSPESRNVPLLETGPNLDDRPATTRKEKAATKQRQKLEEDVLWSGVVLRSKDSRLVDHWCKLRTNPGYRERHQSVLVMGRRRIEDMAKKMKIQPKTLMIREGKPDPDLGRTPHTEIVYAKESVMEVADPGNDGYVGEFAMPIPSPKEVLHVSPRRMDQILVLDNVQDPSLLGTLLRTATSFAYDAVVMTNHCADLYDNRTVRAACGAHFQDLTQFFVLREEDGDDTSEMLCQMLEHHNSQPLVFDSRRNEEGLSVHDYRLTTAKRYSPKAPLSHTLFLGDNQNPTQRLSLPEKLSKRLRRPPTVLTLPDYEEGLPLLVTAPILIYSLRHTAAWEVLTPSQESASRLLQEDTHNNRFATRVIPEPNLVGRDEISRHYNKINQEKFEARYNRYKLSDEERWEKAELSRIHSEARKENIRMASPWLASEEDVEASESSEEARHDPRYPNYVKDMKPGWNHNREDVREEVVTMQTYRRPSQYSQYMAPSRSKY